MLKKFFAFTMAEVLVVIAVIGVTAALALPTVSNNIEEKKVVSALRKIYPELETAYQAVVSQYGKPPEWADADNNTDGSQMNLLFHNKLLKHMTYKAEDSTNRKIILKDNSEIEYYILKTPHMLSNEFDFSTKTQHNSCTGEMGTFVVDINGSQKGENTIGRDKFTFYICYEEGIVPSGESDAGPIANNTNNDNAAWIIKAGNMDYLKCADQLDWNTKRTCK
ncbi:hypothetical protein IKE67_08585 [bacterium]|nr:hypothetical protein [bacterium]